MDQSLALGPNKRLVKIAALLLIPAILANAGWAACYAEAFQPSSVMVQMTDTSLFRVQALQFRALPFLSSQARAEKSQIFQLGRREFLQVLTTGGVAIKIPSYPSIDKRSNWYEGGLQKLRWGASQNLVITVTPAHLDQMDQLMGIRIDFNAPQFFDFIWNKEGKDWKAFSTSKPANLVDFQPQKDRFVIRIPRAALETVNIPHGDRPIGRFRVQVEYNGDSPLDPKVKDDISVGTEDMSVQKGPKKQGVSALPRAA